MSRAQMKTEHPAGSGGCGGSCSLCSREQAAVQHLYSYVTGWGGRWGWRWWEWRCFPLPDSSEAASAQAVVTGQNMSTATKLGTYALEIY